MLEWYRAMIVLRKRLPAPQQTSVTLDEDLRRIVFKRDGICVRVNLGESDWLDPIPEGANLVMASDTTIRKQDGMLCLPPSSVVILEDSAARG
jgi:hypothetical protein